MSGSTPERHRAVSPRRKSNRRRRQETQLHLDSLRHGGRRDGAGRPRTSRQAGHDTRPSLSGRVPVHVTMRVDRRIRLRSERVHRAVVRAIGRAQGRFSMRVVHYSVQHGHLHLLVEAAHRRSLSRGMQGLTIRMSKAINRLLGRPKGRVFIDRYHAEQLHSPRQVRHAMAYVLNNRRRHLDKLGRAQPSRRWVDPFSSAKAKGGVLEPTGPPPCAAPRTWLAATGWKRHGLVRISEVPGS